MSISGISNSNMEALYYNIEQNQAYIMNQNQLVPVAPENVQEVLKDHDITVKNGKAYSISDGFELSPADVAASLSVGGTPELPPTMQVSSANKAENIGHAINRLADTSGTSGLLFQQLMTLMKGAREDKELNDQLTLILQAGKITSMKGGLGAIEAKQKAAVSADNKMFAISTAVQIFSLAASTVSCAAGSNSKAATGMNMASAALNTLPAIFKVASHNSGDYAEKGKQELRSMDFQKSEEILQQTIDSARTGAEGAKESFRSALKLIQDVAQRQTDNIKAMNV